MQKCAWCNKQNDKLKKIEILSTNLSAVNRREISYYVCPEHEPKLRKFYDRVRRHALLFLGLIAMSLIGLMTPTVCSDNYWSGYVFVLSFASIGLVLILFPFCTPETVSMMGVAKSIKTARIIGGVILALGSVGLVLALLHS